MSTPIVGANPKQLERLAEAGLRTREELMAFEGVRIKNMKPATLAKLKVQNGGAATITAAPAAPSPSNVFVTTKHSWYNLAPHVVVDDYTVRGLVQRLIVAPDMVGFEVETCVPGKGRGKSFLTASCVWASHYMWVHEAVFSDDSDDDDGAEPGQPTFKDPRHPLFSLHAFDEMLPPLQVETSALDDATVAQRQKVKQAAAEVNQMLSALHKGDEVATEKHVRFAM